MVVPETGAAGMEIPDKPPRWLSGALILGVIAAAWALERPRPAPAGKPSDPHPTTVGAVPARAGSPYRQRWRWWRQVLVNTYREINDDRLLAVAAGVVFYALLAIFPTITAFVSFYGLLASYSTIGDHISLLSYVLPPGGVGIVQDQIGRIVSNNDGKLGLAFVLGLGIALWSANAGMKALIDALNVVEGEKEERGFVRLNVVSFGFTMGAITFLLLAIGAVVAFPLVMSMFGLEAVTSTATWLVRWPLMLLVVMLALAVLYRFGPSHRAKRWRPFTPGTLFAALAWLAGSAGLSLYLSKFADYNVTYGSLGAAIGLMMWMWLTTIVILTGAELDSEIDKAIKTAAA
jgi:membrane protein